MRNIFKFSCNIYASSIQLLILVCRTLFLKKIFSKRQIWLIGGHAGRLYTDNSAAMHKYIIQNHPEIKVYWVINKDSNDLEKAKEVGPVIIRNSIRNYIYASISRVYIVSHGLNDVGLIKEFLCKDVFKVRLGHGYTAFKKKSSNTFSENDFNLFIVNSKFEKGIIERGWGIKSHKIAITGMPRYDDLYEKFYDRKNRKEKILYMPTWRDWLKNISPSEFEESKFFKGFKSLLLDDKLNDLLNSKDIELAVYIHINMREYANVLSREIRSENIKFLDLEDNLQEEIIESNILITDYSSIAWDFLYLRKPVLFFRTDIDEYEKYRGSYVNLNDETFGPVTDDHDKIACILLSLLDHTGENDLDPNSNRVELFQYRDNNNCRRVLESILSAI